jgi:hypothetical protein
MSVTHRLPDYEKQKAALLANNDSLIKEVIQAFQKSSSRSC